MFFENRLQKLAVIGLLFDSMRKKNIFIWYQIIHWDFFNTKENFTVEISSATSIPKEVYSSSLNTLMSELSTLMTASGYFVVIVLILQEKKQLFCLVDSYAL